MGKVTYRVGTDLEYAAIHEFGGTIEPKSRTFLRFEIGGQEIFTKGPVTIPAQPYLRPALDANRPAVEQAIGAVLGARLQAVAG